VLDRVLDDVARRYAPEVAAGTQWRLVVLLGEEPRYQHTRVTEADAAAAAAAPSVLVDAPISPPGKPIVRMPSLPYLPSAVRPRAATRDPTPRAREV
jgi:hypothetical protein